MQHALKLAKQAESQNEVPIGAVVVLGDKMIGEGWNQPLGGNDLTLHAEIVAMRAACRALGNYRLTGATLYTTLEPCLMCTGAIVHARVSKVVVGALDDKSGALCTHFSCDKPWLNHQPKVEVGVMADASRVLLQSFFQKRRKG